MIFAPISIKANRLGKRTVPAYRFSLNGKTVRVDDDAALPLLHVLRERLDITGTKFGCGAGLCGACTVHVDGEAVRSCQMPLESIEGAEVTTIEGLASEDTLHAVQQAWIEHQVPQCGFCQSGMVMATAAMLTHTPQPTEQDVADTITNLCRCGTYERIKAAVFTAAETLSRAG